MNNLDDLQYAHAAFFKWKEVYNSNIHHNSIRGQGLLVCEGVPMRGHGHVLFLHVTCHLVQ